MGEKPPTSNCDGSDTLRNTHQQSGFYKAVYSQRIGEFSRQLPRVKISKNRTNRSTARSPVAYETGPSEAPPPLAAPPRPAAPSTFAFAWTTPSTAPIAALCRRRGLLICRRRHPASRSRRCAHRARPCDAQTSAAPTSASASRSRWRRRASAGAASSGSCCCRRRHRRWWR